MKSVSQFIEKRLKLKVNQDKSAVDYPTNRKFLGFSFYCIDGVSRIRVHPKSLKRLRTILKELTGRSTGISMEVRVAKLNQTIQGWVNYYKLATWANIAKRQMNGCDADYACAFGSSGRKSVRKWIILSV
jgi:hypothetical protein